MTMREAIGPVSGLSVGMLLLALVAYSCDRQNKEIGEHRRKEMASKCAACKEAYPAQPAQFEHCYQTCELAKPWDGSACCDRWWP